MRRRKPKQRAAAGDNAPVASPGSLARLEAQAALPPGAGHRDGEPAAPFPDLSARTGGQVEGLGYGSADSMAEQGKRRALDR